MNKGLLSKLFGVNEGRGGAAAIGGVAGDDGLGFFWVVLTSPVAAVGLLGRRYLGLFDADDVDASRRSSLLVSSWWQRGVIDWRLRAGGAWRMLRGGRRPAPLPKKLLRRIIISIDSSYLLKGGQWAQIS